jgi:hypothetical protein
MMGMHRGIKTLLMQNLSYTHHLCGLHNTREPYDFFPPTKVLPPCFCCPYACLFTKCIAFLRLMRRFILWVVIQYSHAVDDPPECKDLHSDYADCYGHFHPVGGIPFRSVPVEGYNRYVDSV